MEAAQARLSLHMSKCKIVGNLMSRLKLSLQWPKYDTSGFKLHLSCEKNIKMLTIVGILIFMRRINFMFS